MKDFSVKITVRSARIIDAISDKYGTQSEMARRTGIHMSAINAFVTMRTIPVGLKGWTGAAETFASALDAYPSDLWPDHMRDVKLKRATAEMSLDLAEVKAIASDGINDFGGLLGKAALGLRDRNLDAVSMSAEGATLEEIGAHLGVTRERARQIVFRGYRDMRKKLKKLGVENMTDAMDALP